MSTEKELSVGLNLRILQAKVVVVEVLPHECSETGIVNGQASGMAKSFKLLNELG